jgi:hypothetical protein
LAGGKLSSPLRIRCANTSRASSREGATKLNAKIGNFMVATIVGQKVPAGFKAIDDEQVRGSLLELNAAARIGCHTFRATGITGVAETSRGCYSDLCSLNTTV